MARKKKDGEHTGSKQRAADHGKIFTNEREVRAMCGPIGDEGKKPAPPKPE